MRITGVVVNQGTPYPFHVDKCFLRHGSGDRLMKLFDGCELLLSSGPHLQLPNWFRTLVTAMHKLLACLTVRLLVSFPNSGSDFDHETKRTTA